VERHDPASLSRSNRWLATAPLRHLGDTPARRRWTARLGVVWTRWGALVGAVSLILLSGCADQSATVTLGASKSSAAQGLPVPDQAQLLSPANKPPGQLTHIAYYVLPLGVTISALDHWYGERLVPGQQWHGWMPCLHLILKPSPGTQRGWKRGSSLLYLATSEIGTGQVRVVVTEQGGPGYVHLSC
jgi:hypothetical protein